MADKKISQLPLSSGINTSDISVLVDIDTTEQYSFSQLLTYLAANLQAGAAFTFGTGAIPSNTVGKNGDVYVKTDTGQFAQKLSGVWEVVYTIVNGVVGSTVLYGVVVPTTQGVNGDTYILTTNGTFYQKVSGSWVAKFSMATGPVGPQGAAGTNGTNGVDGKTVLHGTTNPSNLLGNDGDFYVNTTNYTFFGPKAGGEWPPGFSLVGPPGASVSPIKTAITGGVTANPLIVSYNPADYPTGAKYSLLRADGSFDWNTSVVQNVPVSGSATFTVTGGDDGFGHFADNYTFYIMT